MLIKRTLSINFSFVYLLKFGCDRRGRGEAAPGVSSARRGRRLEVEEGQDQAASGRLQREEEINADFKNMINQNLII